MKIKKVLKASAGTGKTYRLSLEYIASLLEGENFDEIMVMTFTRKATGEIKSRILSFLKEIVSGGEEGDEILENIKSLYPSIENDTSRLKEVYSEIIKNKDKLRIYTIDGFTNMIFKKSLAPHLGIYSYEIIDEERNREFYLKILEKLLETKEYFQRFKDFLSDNPEKDIDVYLDLIKSIVGERWKFLLMNRKKREEYATGDLVTFFDSIISDIEAAGKIKSPSKKLSEGLKKDFKEYLSRNTDIEKSKFLTDNFKKLLDTNTFWMKAFINPTKQTKGTEEYKSRIEDGFSLFKVDLARTIFNTKIIPYEENIFEFVDFVFRLYDDLKFREKKFTHTDLSTYTFKYFSSKELNLVENEKVTDYFFQVMDGGITTLFIDEFQDTSILQWKILKSIVNRCEKIICVGDEKQSIYGWRGGEKELFEKLPDIIGGESETMGTSYRSEKEIITFINRFFSSVSETCESDGKNWSYDKVNFLQNKSEGSVHSLISCSDDEVNSFESMTEILKEDIIDYSKVGIIARKNKDLSAIADKLAENHIPFILNSGSPLQEHRALKGIFHLIKYLAYSEYFYLLEFLRSDIVDIDDKELKELIIRRNEIEEYLTGQSTEVSLCRKPLGLIKGLRKKILGSYLISTRDDEGRLDNLALSLIKDFGVLEIFYTNSDVKNILKFYELLKRFDNLENFLDYAEENIGHDELKQAAVDELNAVNIMSIHKSKGLEFETEFFFSKISSRTPPDRGLKFYLKMNETYENVEDYLLTTTNYKGLLKFLGKDFPEKYKSKEEMEELNNLYVSITRAKKNLFIFTDSGCERGKLDTKEDLFLTGLRSAMGVDDNSSLDMRILGQFKEIKKEILPPENIEVSFQEQFDNYALDEDSLRKSKINKVIYSHKMTLEKELRRKRGSALHYFLENITYLDSCELDRSRKLTLSKYGNMLGEKEMIKIFEGDGIKKFFLENSWIFSKNWDHIHNEYQITDEDGSTKRIDRLMIKESSENQKGEIFIIDYKTGEKDDEQIQTYEKIIERILVEQGIRDKYKINSKFIFLHIE